MRTKNKFKLLGLTLMLFGFAACDTAEQNVSSIVSTEDYPVATFSSNVNSNNTVTEGDTLRFMIKTDKWLDRSVTFTFKITGGTADETDLTFLDADGIGAAVLAPYTDSIELFVVINEDNFPELDETLSYEIGAYSNSDRYIINPITEYPSGTITVKNHNDPGKLTIAFSWPNPDDDFDTYAITASGISWGLAASSDNPEIMTDIWVADDDGTFYYGIDPYSVETIETNYTISIGYPNQDVQFFEGVFDLNDLAGYPVDYFSYYDTNFYRLLTIVKSGSSFTVTHVSK